MKHSLIPEIFFVPCTPGIVLGQSIWPERNLMVSCALWGDRYQTNKQIRPFQGAKNTLKKVRTGVCEGRLLDSMDFFQWRRASQRRCHWSWDLNSETWGKNCPDKGQRKQEGANAGSSRAGGKTGKSSCGWEGMKQGRAVRAMVTRPFGPQIMGASDGALRATRFTSKT